MPARVAANLINVPVLPVGLYEWKITPAHPLPTIMFKNILRTFEAEILKIFKNIQPQPQNFNFTCIKKEYIMKSMFQLLVLGTAETSFTRYLSLRLTSNCALVGH